MIRMLADIGNSRLKWAKLREPTAEHPAPGWDEVSLSTSDVGEWAEVWSGWGLDAVPSEWAISSVAPPILARLAGFFRGRGVHPARVFASGAAVPTPLEIERPETSGADRALGVLGALQLPGARGFAGIVVSCGSAITVDRISKDGVWTGGAIAPGLRLAAESLHEKTAQLPRVPVAKIPPPWGRSTIPAIEAGVFWGCVGAIRELIRHQSEGLDPPVRVVWTGGDARILSDAAALAESRWMPGLVFLGLKAAVGW